MTLPALATVDQLATWLNTTIASDDARAQAVLEAASARVRARARTNWVDENGGLEDVPAGIATVTVTVAARCWVNPTSATVARTGPFSGEWDLEALEITDDEAAMIDAAVSSSSPGLFSIPVTRGGLESSTIYLETDPPGDPMPWDTREPW